MRVIAGIFSCVVMTMLAFMLVDMFDGQNDNLQGVQAVKVDWEPAPKSGDVIELPKIEKPINSYDNTTANLFNCRTGMFECDDTMCVFVCEKDVPPVEEEDNSRTVPDRPHGVMPDLDDIPERVPGPSGEYRKYMPRPMQEGEMPTCGEMDEDGKFDCPQDL